MQNYFLFLLLISIFLISAQPFAQTAAEQASQTNQNVIQQYEQQRFDEQLEQTLKREKNAIKNDISVQKSPLNNDGACINIVDIRLTGITLYKPKQFSDLTNAYKNQCLNLSQINSLTEDITNFYIERGFITTRAYIPAQDLSSGILELKIIEGKLEAIEYPLKKKEIKAAFPNLVYKPLNLRDFEQGLDQMNRLKSNNAEISLTPGNENGSSIVQINNNKTKPWHVRTGIDNTGLESTGEEQAFIELDYDNLLSINDLLSLSFKYDLDGRNRRQSRNASGRYEAVYGYWNFNYSLNYFDYISEVSTVATDFKTSGFSRIHDLGVSRVLHRDQNSRTSFSAGLIAKENENFIEDLTLDASSQKLTILNFGLSRSQQIKNGFLFGALNYHRGIGLLGAQEDNGLGLDDPQAEFERVTADMNAAKIVDIGFKKYNPRLDLRIRGQWSADTLFSSEQLSLGGPASIRGFKEASISGDRGVYGRVDVSIPYDISSTPQVQKIMGTLRPYVGFDNGVIKSDSSNPFEGGLLRSWSAGLKNEGGLLDFEISYSQPISSPSFNSPESHDLFFSTSIKF